MTDQKGSQFPLRNTRTTLTQGKAEKFESAEAFMKALAEYMDYYIKKN